MKAPRGVGLWTLALLGAGFLVSCGCPPDDRDPVEVHVPAEYDPTVPAPLLLLLHAYSVNGTVEEFYLDLSAEAEARGYLYAAPTGLRDHQGLHFWNATEACCNLNGIEVDDVAYLRQVIDDIQATFSVDPKRIYLAGHSNGGFMAHRMACDHASRIAAIVSLAGSTHHDPVDCAPTEAVSTLNVHGTFDGFIFYGGGLLLGRPYPGAVETSQRWAQYNGCALSPDDSSPPIDIEAIIPFAETSVRRYHSGCSPGGEVELWTIGAGSHVPVLTSDFRQRVFDFLDTHPKP